MADEKVYVGVDLGGTKILAGVVDSAGKVISRAKKKTRAAEGVDVVVDRICNSVVEAIDTAGIRSDRVIALGIGAAGPVDFDKGVVLTAGNMPWRNVPLRKQLSAKLGIQTVIVDNDVNAGTYGEWKVGAGKGINSQLGIFVGTGIGGGLVLNGQLYRGHFFTAGEIGHTIINAGGSLTGRSLEDLASRGAINVFIARRISTNHPSKVAQMVAAESNLFTDIRSRILADAYAAKDPVTVQIVTEAARYVGTAIANAVTLLSLARVILGGGVVEAIGKPFAKLVEEQMRADMWPNDLAVELVDAQLGDDAVMVGAALMARDVAKEGAKQPAKTAPKGK